MRFFNNLIDSQKVNRSPVFWWLLAAIILCVIYITYVVSDFSNERKEANIKKRVEKVLSQKEDLLDKIIQTVEFNALNKDYSLTTFKDQFLDNNFEVFLFRNDSLKAWSSNLIAIDNYKEDFKKVRVLKLNNGWYNVFYKQSGQLDIYGAILIKQAYNYSNEYLPNNFSEDFRIDDSYEIDLNKSLINVFNDKQEFLFSLNTQKDNQLTDNQAYKLFFVYHLLLLLIIMFVLKFYERFAYILKNSSLLYLIVAVDIIFLWVLLKFINFPAILFDSVLYSPVLFADDFNRSLGGFFTNVLFLLVVFYLVFFKHKIKKIDGYPRRDRIYLIVIALSVGLVIILKSYESAVESLLENSHISIQFGQDLISNFWPTLIIFSIISMLSLALFFVFQRAAVMCNALLDKQNEKLVLITSFIIIYLVSSFTLFDFRPYSLFFVLLIITSYWGIKGDKLKFNSLLIVLYLIIFSAYLSVLSTYVLREKELMQRELIIEKIAKTRDPLAEFSFQEIEQRIYADSLLYQRIETASSDEDDLWIGDHIAMHFNTEIFTNYVAYVSFCNQDKILIDQDDYVINCMDYFSAVIDEIGTQTEQEHLYYIENNSINNSYLVVLEFDTNKDSIIDYTAFVDLISEFIPEGLGYPELFNDETSELLVEDLADYSFVKYQNGELAYKFGTYFYSINLNTYEEHLNESALFSLNDYNHMYYDSGDGTVFIISRKDKAFWELIAPFSYYFMLISLFILCFSIITQFSPKIFKARLSFIHRIQFNFLAIIFTSFVIVAVVTLMYLVKLNDEKNQENLSEKALSVLIELEYKLVGEESIQQDMYEFLGTLLRKWSMVFFSDINLYDLEGKLIASSRPQVYNEGLISRFMNTAAYEQLINEKKLLFIQNERIGNYEYLSAYIPFRNEDGKIIAYLNLPYFARQSELQKEITTFLVALVNIYVLFFVLTIVVAVIISRRISKPIQLIRDRISGIELGKPNEIIEWSREDEIGDLIAEYNRMIIELNRSATLLAKSEREGAWREMAKQVAHEIKNPLTPMKLNVQYLEKAWNEKSDDWEARLKRFTRTIIDQIDTLSQIATEFSDFAKMPSKKIERVNLVTVIRNSLSLFKDTQNIDFKFEYIDKSCVINADRGQILRVFNNLIKNSVQAIGTKREGKISVDIYEQNGYFKIRVIDNGSGISKDMADKIFSPNFTTKSSGMGLGLSIVKSIIIEAGGEIDFESEGGEGAIFNIKLPIVEV